MSNTFGEFLRLTTWGESHGPGIGCVFDGIPAGVVIDLEEIEAALARRRPGQPLTSPRSEPDRPRILSGVHEGRTLGTPLSIWIESVDARSEDYSRLSHLYRPGHADWPTQARYGHRDPRGGGRASARETAARVAAGAVAEAILRTIAPIEIVAWVDRVGEIGAAVDPTTVTRAEVEARPVRCPDPVAAQGMAERIVAAQEAGDSLGGWVRVVARGVSAGWGDPLFGKLKALLAQGMLSLPAAVAFESGDGIASTYRTGSVNNDPYEPGPDGPVPTSNRSGGQLGGISSGAPILCGVGFKPTSTVARRQSTVDRDGAPVEFEGTGRHDPCVLPRAVPVVEAMVALVLADRALARRAAPPSTHDS
ncbi:MAG: chorismate synthase [Planctomycetota bacterium]|jgi:chorismate synthase